MNDERTPLKLSELSGDRDERGLICKKCGCRDLRVIYTRDRFGGRRRKRRCRNCGHEMWTMERLPAS
jgi:hypothetical protein